MPPRASRSPPSATALSMFRPSRASASRASPRETGLLLAEAEVKASMAWTMASTPVAAVTGAGRPSVSSGSSRAMSGNRSGETTPFFSASPVVTMEIGVTSEPVPAVVGHSISGRRGPFALPTP